MWDDAGAALIMPKVLEMHRLPVISPKASTQLSRVDDLSYRAGMLATNPAGLYKPK
jgi:hypothetical protein